MTGPSSAGDGRFVTHRESEDEPQLSVLMPVYNQEAYVEDAIRSVLAQQGIVLDILISDDSSTDGTFAVAERTVASTSGPHRVRLRRGARRLFRDHQELIGDHATCDIHLVAHGDDIAAPTRAVRVHQAIATDGYTMVGSGYRVIDDALRAPADRPIRADAPYVDVDLDGLLEHRSELIGSMVGWRSSALARFPRLDSEFAACAHDRIRPFRAGLCGRVGVIDEPLVERRLHPRSWSKTIWDQRSAETGRFGSGLYRLTALDAMQRDVEVARDEGLISAERAGALRDRISVDRARQWAIVLESHGVLVRQGRLPLWVTESELNLAWRGDLFAAFGRNARATAALARLRQGYDRARRRLGSS